MTLEQMIKNVHRHVEYFESIHAERSAEEMRAVVRMLRQTEKLSKLLAFVDAHDKYWKTRHDADGVALFDARRALDES